MEIIHVIVTDDHPMVTQGLQFMFSNYPHIRLCGVYHKAGDLLEGLVATLPDVLLLDIQLPDTPGDELLPKILQLYPELKVLVVTNFDSPMYANKMLWLGAAGYLLKTADEAELIKAIEVIAAGGRYIEKKLEDKIQQGSYRAKRSYSTRSSLTVREKEILQLIVDGRTDQEIADQLFLGLRTVKYYRKMLILKLDVSNTASLVAKALKMGLAQ